MGSQRVGHDGSDGAHGTYTTVTSALESKQEDDASPKVRMSLLPAPWGQKGDAKRGEVS